MDEETTVLNYIDTHLTTYAELEC
jgi:hypothetical protein